MADPDQNSKDNLHTHSKYCHFICKITQDNTFGTPYQIIFRFVQHFFIPDSLYLIQFCLIIRLFLLVGILGILIAGIDPLQFSRYLSGDNLSFSGCSMAHTASNFSRILQAGCGILLSVLRSLHPLSLLFPL